MSLKADAASEVADLAAALGLRPSATPTKRIIQYCLEQVHEWAAEAGGISSIDDLEALICRRKNLVIIEIWSDDDLEQAIRHYVNELGEKGFAILRHQLEGDGAFGCLFERFNAKRGAHDRYVAFVDCRGSKAYRRFFTRWHEIAHVLTLVDQLELPLNRG
ncbi:MAG: hypothetical protein H0X01_01210, partial [Nitrospira sp.]|nr:hypothetical protein [Nitrospira sp.]